jgi:hypothetical protein
MLQLQLLNKRIKHALALIKNGAQPSVAAYLDGNAEFAICSNNKVVNAGNVWDDYRKIINNEFQDNPMGFLRQPIISRTVHPNQQSLAKAYLESMAKDNFALHNILPRLHDVPIGDPFLCEFFPLASPMSVQHAWYMLLMKRHLNLFVPNAGLNHILEIGGGYGNFCRLVCSFGYDGRYVIADLPEMHRIQRHFLGHSIPERMATKPVEFRSLQDPGALPEQQLSLLIATFSLSEMPLTTRLALEPIYENFDYLFFAYNSAFGEEDNLKYFDQLRDQLSNRFEFESIFESIPDEHRQAWFLIGSRKPTNRNGF